MLSYFALAPVAVAVILYLLPFERIGRAVALAAQAALAGFSCHLFFLCKRGDVVSQIGGYGALAEKITEAANL